MLKCLWRRVVVVVVDVEADDGMIDFRKREKVVFIQDLVQRQKYPKQRNFESSMILRSFRSEEKKKILKKGVDTDRRHAKAGT